MAACMSMSTASTPLLRQRGVSTRRAGVAAPIRASAGGASQSDEAGSSSISLGRRTATALVLGLAAAGSAGSARADEGVKIVHDKEGFGSKVAKAGDLVLVNYYGRGFDPDYNLIVSTPDCANWKWSVQWLHYKHVSEQA
jgi:hypothetical protein